MNFTEEQIEFIKEHLRREENDRKIKLAKTIAF